MLYENRVLNRILRSTGRWR